LQIRALYSYLRMMPAYKLFRDRIKQKNSSYQLNYKFTRPDQSSGSTEFGAGMSFSSLAHITSIVIMRTKSITLAAISTFNFQEIKSSFGVLNVSVKYRKDFTPPQVSHVLTLLNRQLELTIFEQQNIQQVIVDNYKPEQLPRRQSLPPQPIPVPSTTNNANINNMMPSQPMSINARVSPQDIYNRNRDAAQSAPITIPHKGRERSYSTADVPQKSHPINMPGPSPGPRMPFIPEHSGPLKSPQFPSDWGTEATPPFSTNYLSTSSGTEGINRLNTVSSTPPFKMASPPSSIFKPFKASPTCVVYSTKRCVVEPAILIEHKNLIREVHTVPDQHLTIPRLTAVTLAKSNAARFESWHDNAQSSHWSSTQSIQSHILR